MEQIGWPRVFRNFDGGPRLMTDFNLLFVWFIRLHKATTADGTTTADNTTAADGTTTADGTDHVKTRGNLITP